MNMYLQLSETTIITILGTILKMKRKIFIYIQSLAYLQLMFTSVINFFKKHIYFSFFNFGHAFAFLGLFQICPNPKYPSFSVNATFVLSCPMYPYIVKITI